MACPFALIFGFRVGASSGSHLLKARVEREPEEEERVGAECFLAVNLIKTSLSAIQPSRNLKSAPLRARTC